MDGQTRIDMIQAWIDDWRVDNDIADRSLDRLLWDQAWWAIRHIDDETEADHVLTAQWPRLVAAADKAYWDEIRHEDMSADAEEALAAEAYEEAMEAEDYEEVDA